MGLLDFAGENTITGSATFEPNFATVTIPALLNQVAKLEATNIAMEIPSGVVFNFNNAAQLNDFTSITNE